jgi:glutamate dehydrogenase (NADP+)
MRRFSNVPLSISGGVHGKSANASKIWRKNLSNVPLSISGGVHGKSANTSKIWRNKPLLRREGDKIFKTGTEAMQLLNGEALRRDGGRVEFLQSWEGMVNSLGVVFERMPKYAWVMKQLLEPERTINFRVAWLDDTGVSRVNRGYRVQYSSALGPFEGGTVFSPR